MRRLVILHQNEENNEHLSVISSLEFRKFLRQRIKVSGFKETQAVNEDALYLALQKVETEMMWYFAWQKMIIISLRSKN